MKRSRVGALWLSVLPLYVQGCELADLDFLQPDATMVYEFTQTKTVAALSRPLISNGVFGLNGQQLVWQTLRPLKSTLVISSAGLKQFNRDDVLVSKLNNPQVAELAQVFLNLLSGNMTTLAAAFTQTLSCEGDQWQLELVPASEATGKLLTSISLSGAEHIEQLAFREVRGDDVVIELAAQPDNTAVDFERYLGH